MATNYELLQTALETKAAELSDDASRYKALIIISQYIAALTMQATATATDVSSYSISGRSVSRQSSANVQSQVSALEQQLNEILYGNITLADFRTNFVDTGL